MDMEDFSIARNPPDVRKDQTGYGFVFAFGYLDANRLLKLLYGCPGGYAPLVIVDATHAWSHPVTLITDFSDQLLD